MDRATGHLEVDGTCLYLVDDEKPDHRWIPNFPEKVSRWDDGDIVVGETKVKLGQTIISSGGDLGLDLFKTPAGCDPTAHAWALSAGIAVK